MVWRLACVVALLAWQQPAPPAQSPPAGVYQARDVDALPRLIREVKPAYTGQAMRARIQGEVILSCVVLADGSVGDVHVAKSLDATYGLDEQAIAAVKQWRFSPGIKAGTPVPVLVDVNLSFTLRSDPASSPTLTWPSGFDAPLDEATKQAEWREDTFEVLNLRIKIRYPAGWTLVKGASEHEIIGLRSSSGTSMLAMSPPQPAGRSLDRPLEPAELRATAERMTQSAGARGMHVESLGFGQAPAASHIWVWHAFKIPNMVTPNMPPAAAAAAERSLDGGRIWAFYGTSGDREFTILCISGIPRGASDTEKTAYITSQASVFGEILRRLSISIVP